MDEGYITIKSGQESQKSPEKNEKEESPREGISLRAKLVIILLAVLFVALNGVGYYLYREGYFGAGADIAPQATPTQTPAEDGKRDTIFMIPEAP